MGDRLSARKGWLPVLVAAGFVFLQTTGRTQDRAGKTGAVVAGPEASLADLRSDETALRRLSRELRVFRSAGDRANAARVFRQMFPPEAQLDAAASVKISGLLPSNRIEGTVGNVKDIVAGRGTVPVFFSPDDEKNPAAGAWISRLGGSALFSAAEQWTGGRPGAIRIRKSSDAGASWPETLVIGDGRAWTGPSLGQVSEDAVGLAFVRDGDGPDGDIVFARLDADLSKEAEFPVAFGGADERNPSLAADFEAYPLPFIYIVYAESEGGSRAVKLRVSPDLGASWSRDVTIGAFSGTDGPVPETAIAYDPGRNALHVAFTRPQGRAAGIAVSTSRTFGASWSEPVLITPPDDLPDSSPRIAAGDGAVLVVYEHGTVEGGADIVMASSPNSGKTWTGREDLASSAASERFPDIRAAATAGPPRFFTSFIEDGSRIRVLSLDGGGRGAWVTERTLDASGAAIESGPAVLVPFPAAAGRGLAGVLWTRRNPDSDVLFGGMELLEAALTVTPSHQDVASGAGTTEFSVEKTGGGQVDWTAAVVSGQDWLSVLSGASGTNSGTIVAAVLANPDPASRIGSIKVTPSDESIPSVTVTVTQAGAALLDVQPGEGLASSGPEGGPFAPSGKDYTLTNAGGTAFAWTAAVSEPWLSVSPASGDLAPGATAAVAVTIGTAADSLAPGGYAGEVSFTNVTNGAGSSSRPVSLTVIPGPGALAVSPAEGLVSAGPAGGPFSPSVKSYVLSNGGGTPIDWTASRTQAWTSLSAASGTLDPGADVTVVVSIDPAAEALPEGTYDDTVTFTNSTSGLGTTARPVALTIVAPGALEVTPAEGFAASGLAGGPFSPSSRTYTLRNVGEWPIGWTASKTQGWISLSAASGALDPGATSEVVVSLNSGAEALAVGGYQDTVTFANVTNGTGATTRPVTLTVEPRPGVLEVTPSVGLASSGFVGGPFTPSSLIYTLRNIGDTTIGWTASKSQPWTSVSGSFGSLTAGATATVTVSINAAADGLADGIYNDAVVFANTTNGNGGTTRTVTLTVSLRSGVLVVTPVTGLTATGPTGGPFTPSSQVYTLQNAGETAISWTASKSQAWVGLSATAGTLAGGAATTVTVSIDAAAGGLPPGGYGDTVHFVNATNGAGDTIRPVTLTIGDAPVLSVLPAGRDVAVLAGTTTFAVANTGGGALVWTATVVAGGDWLSIQSGASGTGSGTIVAAFTDNRTAATRVGIIRVTAGGAGGSPKDVTVSQAAGAFGIGLSAQRLVEKAWIIQREYGKLTVTVVNPAAIPVDAFIIYRRIGIQPEQVLQQIAGSAVGGSTWTYNDTFLEPGTNYTYRVVALDSLGQVLGTSNPVII